MKTTIRRKWLGKTALLGSTLLLGFAVNPAAAGSITGTKHDLSGNGWSGGQICVVCHTPHNANTSVTAAPLWNHAVTAKSFALYSSPTLTAVVAQPDGSSKLCVSCHDGTVAIDSFGGATGTNFMTGADAVGKGPQDLTDDHPISFTYDAALATADGSLFDPAVKTVTIGTGGTKTKTGTVAALMLYSGKLQCASCHDVHNTFTANNGTGGGAPLLRVSKAGSALCVTCHDK